MIATDIKNFCLQWDARCTGCDFAKLCGKPPYSWNDKDIEAVDSSIKKRDELEETLRRR